MKAFKILLIILFLSDYILFAQKDTLNKKCDFELWGNIGGVSDLGNLLGYDFGINVGFNKRHYILLRKYQLINISGITLSLDPQPNTLLNLSNYSLMYGFEQNQSSSFSSIFSIGLSYGNGLYRGDQTGTSHAVFIGWDTPIFKEDAFHYIGIPLSVTFLFSDNPPIVGLSIDLYANIHKHPDAGLILNLNFGKLPSKKKK